MEFQNENRMTPVKTSQRQVREHSPFPDPIPQCSSPATCALISSVHPSLVTTPSLPRDFRARI